MFSENSKRNQLRSFSIKIFSGIFFLTQKWLIRHIMLVNNWQHKTNDQIVQLWPSGKTHTFLGHNDDDVMTHTMGIPSLSPQLLLSIWWVWFFSFVSPRNLITWKMLLGLTLAAALRKSEVMPRLKRINESEWIWN